MVAWGAAGPHGLIMQRAALRGKTRAAGRIRPRGGRPRPVRQRTETAPCTKPLSRKINKQQKGHPSVWLGCPFFVSAICPGHGPQAALAVTVPGFYAAAPQGSALQLASFLKKCPGCRLTKPSSSPDKRQWPAPLPAVPPITRCPKGPENGPS